MAETEGERELGGQAVRGAGLAGAGFALTRIVNLLSYLVIAQLIVPRDAGDFAAASLFLGVGALFADSGTTAALIQWRGDVEREAASTATVSTIAAGLALTALAAAAAPLLGLIFHSGHVTNLALAMCALSLLRALQIVPDALLQRRFSFARRVAVDPLGMLVFGVAAIVACSNGLGAWGLVIGSYSSQLAMVVAAWAFLGWAPSRHEVSWAVWRRLAGFGRHVLASEILRTAALQVDALVLGNVKGTAALGNYRYGNRLATQPSDAWVTVAAYVLYPSFARIAYDRRRLAAALSRAASAMYALVLPFNLALAALGPTLVYVLLGPRWHAAGPVVIALAAYGIGLASQSLAAEVSKSIGEPNLLTRQWLVGIVLLVVAVLALVTFGAVGVGAAVSLSGVGMGAYSVNQVWRRVGLSRGKLVERLVRMLIAAAIAAAAAGLLDAALNPPSHGRGVALAELVADSLVMTLAYLVTLRVLAHEELSALVALLRPAGRRLVSRRARPVAG